MLTDDEKRELVAEARKAQRAVYLATDEHVAEDLSRIIRGLADALEGTLPGPGEWEYARCYYDMAGEPQIRKADDLKAPDGHYSDGRPYWNYEVVRRGKAGPWEVVPDV